MSTGTVEGRAARYAALGEPIRLAVAERLRVTDLTPQDIVVAFDVRSNLLAHHLNVMEQAGLLRRQRSRGDRRRRYLRLDDAAGSLGVETPCIQAASVRFVCADGAGWSPLAAAIWRSRSAVPVSTAGLLPSEGVHRAVQAAAARRSMGPLVHTSAEADPSRSADLTITLCDLTRESIDPDVAAGTQLLHWSLPTLPSHDGPEMDRGIDLVASRIEVLLDAVPGGRATDQQGSQRRCA